MHLENREKMKQQFSYCHELLPVKSEHRAVYVNVRDFDEGLQPQKYVQHDEISVPENNSPVTSSSS